MIKHIIVAASLLVSPLSATKVDWLDDVAVKYGFAPRRPGDTGTVWYSAEMAQARYERPDEPPKPKTVKAIDPHSLGAVMDRLREEMKAR